MLSILIIFVFIAIFSIGKAEMGKTTKKYTGSGNRGAKTPGMAVAKQVKKTPPEATRTPARTASGSARDHDHIPSTELSHSRKLEQLKTLREAGLLTNEEYDQARRKLMTQAAAGR